MKIKTDFITNSSSTSFVGWGIIISEEDIVKNKKVLETAFDSYKSRLPGENPTIENFIRNTSYPAEILEELEFKTLTYSFRDDYEIYLGGEFNKMNDDETLKEYKKRILDELNEIGFSVNELTFIEESWRDG